MKDENSSMGDLIDELDGGKKPKVEIKKEVLNQVEENEESSEEPVIKSNNK